MQDDFIDRMVVEQGLDRSVINNDGEEQLAILPQPVHERIIRRIDRRVSAAVDDRLQKLVDGFIGPTESLERGFVDQQTQKLLNTVLERLFGEWTRHVNGCTHHRQHFLLHVQEKGLQHLPVSLAHVTQQTILPNESPAALAARFRLLPGVCEQVELQRRLNGKRFLASWALIRLDASVQNTVTVQILLAHKGLVASGAGVRLDFVVHVTHVHLQASLSVEAFPAQLAGKSVFSSVVEKVGLQSAYLDKLLAAEMTLVRSISRVST